MRRRYRSRKFQSARPHRTPLWWQQDLAAAIEALDDERASLDLDLLCQIVEGVSHFVVLAERIRVPVVSDFRAADVARGVYLQGKVEAAQARLETLQRAVSDSVAAHEQAEKDLAAAEDAARALRAVLAGRVRARPASPVTSRMPE